MFTALITFLGGATVRLLLGHVFDFVTKWQDSKSEIAHLRLQGELDAAQHARNLEAIRLQADMGVKVIEAQTVAHVTQADADSFLEAVKGVNEAGNRPDWIGAFNALIRPELAQVSILLLVGNALAPNYVTLSPLLLELICAVLGVFVGGRIHSTGR